MVLTSIFAVAAVLAVVFAVVAVVHSNPIMNVLALVMVFFFLAAIFAILGMDFLAAVQLVVYSGAVLVLFLFVIMLLNLGPAETIGSGRPLQAVLGAIAAIATGALVVAVLMGLTPSEGAVLPGAEHGTVFPIGRALLGSHLFAFELISLLLVAAIVGAVYLAKKELR